MTIRAHCLATLRSGFLAAGLVLAGFALAPQAQADDVLAVSNNGQAVVVGSGRVLYQLDPQTMKVVQRTRVNQPVQGVALNADGSLLVSADGIFDCTITIRETKSGKITRTLEGAKVLGNFGSSRQLFAVAPAGDLAACHIGTNLVVLSLKDGSDEVSIPLPKDPLHLVAISADSKTLAMISAGIDNDEQKDPPPAPGTPAPAKDDLWKMQHDGKGSVLTTYELPSGKQLARIPLWYSADAHMTAIAGYSGDDVLVLTYSNKNARIHPDGKVELFRHCDSFGYGMAIALDGKTLAAGSMIKSGGATLPAAGGPSTPIKGATDVPGFPEYYAAMAFDQEGTLYGLTSAQRAYRVGADHIMTVIEPVY